MDGLADSLRTRYNLSGRMDDLEQAISLHQATLELCPEGHPERSGALASLASSLRTCFNHGGRTDDLEQAISLERTTLELRPEGHPERSGALANLASSLRVRFNHSGRMDDLEQAISLERAALDLRPEGHRERSATLTNLASSLWTRFNHSGRMDDLEQAISLDRTALEFLPEGHPGRTVTLANLAASLRTRFNHGGSMDDLEQAISLERTALELCPEGHTSRSTTLRNLTLSLCLRFYQRGKLDDLEQAISLGRTALELCPEGHPERSTSLGSLAHSLWMRFYQRGKMDDLEEVTSLFCAALELCPDGHPGRSALMANLADGLRAYFNHGRRMDDLEQAISLGRAALKLRPEGHPERSWTLAGLATSLWMHFNHGGRMDDLEQAISLGRAALELRPEGHPARSWTLVSLASSLWARFNHGGRMDDLEQAISLECAALELCPEGHPERSTSLGSLAHSLWMRFYQRGKMDDLEEVISLFRASLELRPEGHPERSATLAQLALGLQTCFNHSGRMDDLEQAISLNRAALDLRPEGHPERSAMMANLADGLWACFNRGRRMDDLEQAISLHRTSLELCPEGHPARSVRLLHVADCLYARFQKDLYMTDLQESIHCLSRAALHPSSSFPNRLDSAHRWTAIARSHNHDTLLEAHRTFASLLQRALTIRHSLSEQHEFLCSNRRYRAFALDAASDATNKGELALAIEFLEQGRALLWSQMRGFRTPLEHLSQVNGKLSEKFEKCSHGLEALLTWSESCTTGSSSSTLDISGLSALEAQQKIDHMLARIRQLSEEQKAIIADIRQVSGFEDFLKAPSFRTIQSAAAEGPVIVLNHSECRCDVLIVLAREVDPCVCIPLDTEFYQDAIDLHDELIRIRKHPGVDSSEYDEMLRRVMKVLWDRVVSKVVQKLKELGINEGSRIWWCPTSVLSAFPFHAAGPYKSADGKDRYLLDDYISSYTPTLSSLINARSSSHNGDEKMLFIGDSSLSYAKEERNAMRTAVKSGSREFKGLLGKRATPEAVLELLQGAHWVHFACHGVLAEEPFNSSLELSGGKLTLLDIARANLPNAEFAFLSACHTAEQGPESALDESLHLAAGMHFCGFRSVVGTMWELLDADGPFLAEVIYEHMMRDLEDGEIRFKRAAEAVRSAAVNLRDNRYVELKTGTVMAERWVNLVHIGA